MSKGVTILSAHTICLPKPDIDTDQILPARFMATTQAAGFGDALFHDERVDARGIRISNHPLNAKDAPAHSIMIGGPNFGSGSSREHAVWAARDFGIKAVLSPKLADIFKANMLNNGLLAFEISVKLFEWLIAKAGVIVNIDLPNQTVGSEEWGFESFEIDAFSKRCILDGVDRLGYLLSLETKITRFEKNQSEN